MKNEKSWTTPFNRLLLLYFSSVTLAFIAARVVILHSWHWDIGGIENSVFFSVSKALYGLPLYGDPESGNFDITQYTPAFYHCLIAICRLADINPMEDWQKLHLLGRYLSLTFNLAGSWVVFRLLANVFRVESRIAVFAAMVSFLVLTDFHFSARPDSLFFLFGTVMTYCMCAYLSARERGERSIGLALGILTASFSMFVKQTGIEYLGFIPLFFLSQRMFRECFWSAGALLLATGAFYLFFRGIHGPFFNKNVIGGLNNGISLEFMANLFLRFLAQHQMLVLAGVASVIHSLLSKRESTPVRFLCLLAVWLFVFAVGTSSKRGSWFNYYTEFLNTLIIVTAIKADRLVRLDWVDDGLAKALGALTGLYFVLILPGLLALNLKPKLEQHVYRTGGEYAQKVSQKRRTAEYARSLLKEGEYLLVFDKHMELMLADRSVTPNREIIPKDVSYDYSGFYNAIDNGTIRYVLMSGYSPDRRFMGIDFSSFKEKYEDEFVVLLENTR
jgi:hypothetical protein